MLLLLLFVVILFISICVIKLYKRSKKFVFKPGNIKDFQKFSREPQHNESFRPFVYFNNKMYIIIKKKKHISSVC